MADFGSISGHVGAAERSPDPASAYGVRDAGGGAQAWPPGLVALVAAVIEVVEDEVEHDLAEARREADDLRARIAGLEAALTNLWASVTGGAKACGHDFTCNCADATTRDALSGGTASLDAAVAKAVLAERARIRAAVKAMIERDYLYVGRKVSDLVEAILREIGGAS